MPYDSMQPRCDRVAAKDIGEITRLFRRCFPDSLAWRMPLSTLRKRQELWGDLVEAWMLRSGQRVLGGYILIPDHAAFVKRPAVYSEKVGKLTAAALHPTIAFRNAARKLKRYPPADVQDDNAGKLAWLELIAVYPEWRGQGYGTVLLKHCERRATLANADALKFCVKAGNTGAIAFYKHNGYEMRGQDRDVFYMMAAPLA